MYPLLRSVLALVAGWLVGSGVNMALITLNTWIYPLPAGTDPNDFAALSDLMAQASPAIWLLPLLAHSGGTLIGAWLAAKLAGRAPFVHALIIGVLFLCGGITMLMLVRFPVWFAVVDLALYLPAAALGAILARGRRAELLPV